MSCEAARTDRPISPLLQDHAFKDNSKYEIAPRAEREPSKPLGASSKNFGCGEPATSRRNQRVALFFSCSRRFRTAAEPGRGVAPWVSGAGPHSFYWRQ